MFFFKSFSELMTRLCDDLERLSQEEDAQENQGQDEES